MLSIIEARILGCLLEKERTTPDQYPLSLNALVQACNQSTNREPVMTLDPHDVESTLTEMKASGFVRLVHPSHGRSVTRYRQVVDERFGWSPETAAVMAVLMLRGPQTVGELRTRSERLHDFPSVDAVESTLRDLAGADPALAVRLERAPGQKEARWQQLLAEEAAPVIGSFAPVRASGHVDPLPGHDIGNRLDELEARVARLEAALADLL